MCAMCRRTVTTPGTPAAISGSTSPTRSGSLSKTSIHEVPRVAVEALQLHGLDDPVVGGAGIDGASRQQERQAKVLQARRLLHDVLAGKVISCLAQHLLERLGIHVASLVQAVAGLGLGQA